MRIGNHEFTGKVHEEVLPLPHGEEIIAIRARAIDDASDFDELCPAPKAPGRLTKDGWVPQEDDEGYKAQLRSYNDRKLGWLVMKSLQDVEWDTVVEDNPSTWANWDKDLQAAGFSQGQRNLILDTVLSANSLNEKKLERARADFFRGQQAEAHE